MTVLTITIMSLMLFALVVSKAQTSEVQAPTPSSIKISRNDSLESKKASGDYFTGAVQVQELFPADDPSRTSGGKVTFEPGARSAWHTHPLGQILIVTDGTGWVQQWGGPIEIGSQISSRVNDSRRSVVMRLHLRSSGTFTPTT